MNRISLLPLIAFFLLGCANPEIAPRPTKRPNIVFIFSDDHAPHAIGSYAGRYAKLDPTPHIDALARDGVRFAKSFCTNSICGPSRAVILTGKHSHKNGFMKNGNRFNGDQVTFPKLLRKAGYRTAMIGKWHLHTDPQGFDYWDILPGQGDYYNPTLMTKQGPRQVEGYCTDIVTGLAIDWMKEQAKSDAPFLLMCQHKAPHRNWMPAPRHLDLYDDVEIPEPPTLFDDFADNASPARHQEMEVDRHMHMVYDLFLEPGLDFDPKVGKAMDSSGFRNLKRMTKAQRAAWDRAFADENEAFRQAKLTGKDLVRWKYQRYMKNYLRTIRGVDDSVGAIRAYLKEAGLADNTIVVYSSDQGFYLGDHGWFDKRWMYDESMAMPLIFSWPGVTEPGRVDTHLVQNLDYAETFLDVAGAPIPEAMQGRSLVPLLRGAKPTDWRSSLYYHYYGYPAIHRVARHYGIRTSRYKLIHFYQFDEWEFYDLESDPDEVQNIYGEREVAEQITRLKRDLAALQVHYDDASATGPMPKAWRRRMQGGR